MRIAVCHNQPTGGARRALHAFCGQLNQRHTLDVFALDTSDDEWLHDADVAERVYRIPLKRHRPIRLGLYLNDAIARINAHELDAAYASMARAVDSSGYDVVLVDACRFSLVPSVINHLHTPSVYYAHNGPAWLEGDAWDPSRTSWERMRDVWHRPLARASETSLASRQRASLHAASGVATNSRHTAQRLRAAYGIEAEVCPPGVPLPATSGGRRRSSFVLSVGEFEPRKGFSFLLDVLARVSRSVRPPLRVLANRANATELSHVSAKAREAGVDLDVRIAPDAGELAWHYAHAMAFLYAAYNEPLGLAPLEAMACGTPVVAVAEGGVNETVRSGVTGCLVERDVSKFAQSLERLLRNEGARVALGRAARADIAANWDVPSRTIALENLLESIAQTDKTTQS